MTSFKTLFVSLIAVFALTMSVHAQSLDASLKELADMTASQMQRKISPNTGHSAYGVVKGYTYNENTGILTVRVETYWRAKRYMLASSYESFNVDGYYTINTNTERFNFTTTYKNDSVRYAWSGSDAILGMAVVAAVIGN